MHARAYIRTQTRAEQTHTHSFALVPHLSFNFLIRKLLSSYSQDMAQCASVYIIDILITRPETITYKNNI